MTHPQRTFAGLLFGSFAAFALPSPLSAQGASPAPVSPPIPPMTPVATHEALTFFEGSWTVEERPADQGLVETCAWLPAGRRHMVCRATWRVASGPREGWSIFSYSSADSTYLYHGLRPGGTVEQMRGRRLGDGWEFTSEAGAGSARQRARVTIARLDGRRFRLVAESATGDGPWKVEDTEHYVPLPRQP